MIHWFWWVLSILGPLNWRLALSSKLLLASHIGMSSLLVHSDATQLTMRNQWLESLQSQLAMYGPCRQNQGALISHRLLQWDEIFALWSDQAFESSQPDITLSSKIKAREKHLRFRLCHLMQSPHGALWLLWTIAWVLFVFSKLASVVWKESLTKIRLLNRLLTLNVLLLCIFLIWLWFVATSDKDSLAPCHLTVSVFDMWLVLTADIAHLNWIKFQRHT